MIKSIQLIQNQNNALLEQVCCTWTLSDNNDFDFVICKNVSDAIRLYNLFKNKYLKQKNILFKGMVTKKSEKTQEVFKMLKDKTGWEDTKIYRKSTRA